MKLNINLFIVFLLIGCFYGCNSHSLKEKIKNESRETLIEVRVEKEMGDMPSDSIQYLPLIGNIANAKLESERKYQYLVLGKNISRKDHFLIKKIATLVFEEGGIEKRLFLAFPISEEYNCLAANNFDEFATRYISIKWQLENYYNHFAGLGKSKFVKWELINY